MYNFPIGVMLDSFRLPVKEAIAKTVAIGAKGFQMYATYGEHSPENMTPAKASATLAHCTRLSFSLKNIAPMSTENSGFM